MQGALKQSFPRLWQTLLAAPNVTNGWQDVPGLNGMTRFDGTTPVKSVPELRDYFSKDLVAAVEANRADFQKVADKGGVGYIPWLLLVVGAVVLAFGLLMAARAKSGPPGKAAWGVVVLVGVVILGLVVGLSYYPRLDAADKVIGNLKPAFAKERTAGDAAGIAMVHQIILFSDPLMTAKGGGSDEVPKLVKFVADKTGLSSAQVLAALTKKRAQDDGGPAGDPAGGGLGERSPICSTSSRRRCGCPRTSCRRRSRPARPRSPRRSTA